MELKSEVDATGMNLGRNLSFLLKKVICVAQEITDHQKINNHIFSLYKKLFKDCKMTVKRS